MILTGRRLLAYRCSPKIAEGIFLLSGTLVIV